jgi:hypothetical protein
LPDLGQLCEGVCKAGTRRYVGPEVVEAPAEVLDEGVAGDDNPGGAVSLQSSHRAESSLEAPMVGLEQVVGVGFRTVEGSRKQFVDQARVDPIPVGGDLGG